MLYPVAFTDSAAFIIYLCLELLLPVQKITFARMLSLSLLALIFWVR